MCNAIVGIYGDGRHVTHITCCVNMKHCPIEAEVQEEHVVYLKVVIVFVVVVAICDVQCVTRID